MKKICFLLSVVLILCAAGCSQKVTPSDTQTPTTSTTSTATESTSSVDDNTSATESKDEKPVYQTQLTDNPLTTNPEKEIVIMDTEDCKIVFKKSDTIIKNDNSQTDYIVDEGAKYNVTLKNDKGYELGGVVESTQGTRSVSIHKDGFEVARASFLSEKTANTMIGSGVYISLNEGNFNGQNHKVYETEKPVQNTQKLVVVMTKVDGIQGFFLIATYDGRNIAYDICELITYSNFS